MFKILVIFTSNLQKYYVFAKTIMIACGAPVEVHRALRHTSFFAVYVAVRHFFKRHTVGRWFFVFFFKLV